MLAGLRPPPLLAGSPFPSMPRSPLTVVIVRAQPVIATVVSGTGRSAVGATEKVRPRDVSYLNSLFVRLALTSSLTPRRIVMNVAPSGSIGAGAASIVLTRDCRASSCAFRSEISSACALAAMTVIATPPRRARRSHLVLVICYSPQ